MKHKYSFGCLLVHGALALSLLVPQSANAQVEVYSNYQERIGSRSIPSAQDVDAAFGARTNVATGGLSFSVPVLSIPGNNGLDISVVYKMGVKNVAGSSQWYFEEDEPYLSGTFSESAGWTSKFGGTSRCSNVNIIGYGPPDVPSSNGRQGIYYRDEYWSGYYLSTPSGGGRLNRFKDGYHFPNPPATGDGYYWATNSYWYFSCIPLSVGVGEGFVGHSPDGLKYFFNTMREGPWLPDLWKHNSDGQELELTRKELRIYAGKVEDRFGNYVTGLTSSDGRNVVKTVSGSTITYTYDARQWVVQTAAPFTVTYPDGSTWTANISGRIYDSNSPITCGSQGGTTPSSAVATIKSPSGATAAYTVEQVSIGYSYVHGECIPLDDGGTALARGSLMITYALVKRVVSGPGLSTQTLDIGYGPANDCYSQQQYWAPKCTSTSPTSRTVTHSYSDGRYNRYTVGNRVYVSSDLILKLEEGIGSSPPSRTTEYEYLVMPEVGTVAGTIPYSVGEHKRTVLVSKETIQDGRLFSWKVASNCGSDGTSLCTDQYGRPTKVIKSSAPFP